MYLVGDLGLFKKFRECFLIFLATEGSISKYLKISINFVISIIPTRIILPLSAPDPKFLIFIRNAADL